MSPRTFYVLAKSDPQTLGVPRTSTPIFGELVCKGALHPGQPRARPFAQERATGGLDGNLSSCVRALSELSRGAAGQARLWRRRSNAASDAADEADRQPQACAVRGTHDWSGHPAHSTHTTHKLHLGRVLAPRSVRCWICRVVGSQHMSVLGLNLRAHGTASSSKGPWTRSRRSGCRIVTRKDCIVSHHSIAPCQARPAQLIAKGQRQKLRMEELEAKVRMHEQQAVGRSSPNWHAGQDPRHHINQEPSWVKADEWPRSPLRVSPAGPPALSSKARDKQTAPSPPMQAPWSARGSAEWAEYRPYDIADSTDPESASESNGRRRLSTSTAGGSSRTRSSRSNAAFSADTGPSPSALQDPLRTRSRHDASPRQSVLVHDANANVVQQQQHGQDFHEIDLGVDLPVLFPSDDNNFVNFSFDREPAASAQNVLEDEFLAQIKTTLQCELDPMDVAFTGPNIDPVTSLCGPTTSTIDWSQCDFPHLEVDDGHRKTHSRNDSVIADVDATDVSPCSGRSTATHASQQERMKYIAECAKSAGFQDFDEAIEAYYNSRFNELSDLCAMQKLSRNRHLPEVLAEIRRAAQRWTKWERHGFEQEMVRCAEEILKGECDAFHTLNSEDDGETTQDAGKRAGVVSHAPSPDLGSVSQGWPKFGWTARVPNLFSVVLSICAESDSPSSDGGLRSALTVMSTICGHSGY
ncbi:hypothetical protein M409DRAFT_61705 [Zasmidium cellare ATCC 36951]|uniref:Uncharacterized protein n=1 Tax=Zasmidium cellare ATCC 36951 TaxID=1080233 RepID=A0A6A6BUG5_ZASCE|nr:uncharacterized protein M409DRAFT_61705 [Zasmidium cellare ATCC 36951]KAF2158381.1 hypothetical protein M409DRAFT_61705 [Zasmidium cellare ATCC 36951]